MRGPAKKSAEHDDEQRIPLVDAILRGAFVFPIDYPSIEGNAGVLSIGLDLGFPNIEIPSPDPQLAFLYIENAIDGFGGEAGLRGFVRLSHARPPGGPGAVVAVTSRGISDASHGGRT